MYNDIHNKMWPLKSSDNLRKYVTRQAKENNAVCENFNNFPNNNFVVTSDIPLLILTWFLVISLCDSLTNQWSCRSANLIVSSPDHAPSGDETTNTLGVATGKLNSVQDGDGVVTVFHAMHASWWLVAGVLLESFGLATSYSCLAR